MNTQTTQEKIDATHPLYDKLQKQRDVFQAVFGGTETIRAGGKTYLPKYPGETDSDYNHRLSSATIDGIVRHGVDTLSGKVFDEEIDTSKVLLPSEWLENFDLEGTHFNNFARDAFEKSFDGFSVILADMPAETESARFLKETYGAEAERMLEMRPFAKIYSASNVLDWDYATDSTTNVKKLVMLKLREVSQERINRFEREDVTRYRIYELINGVVTWELYRKVQRDKYTKPEFLLEGNGIIANVDEIPVAVVGCFTDQPKLLNETQLEIKAYQKESSFDVIEYLSIPIFYTIGYPKDEPALVISASTHLRLPADENAAVGFAQIDSAGHDSLKGTIREIKNEIRQKLSVISEVAAQSPDKTATESLIENSDKHARLLVWADELKDALERTLQFMGQLAGMGEDAAGEIILMTAWERAEMQAMERQAKEDEMQSQQLMALED